MFSNCSRKDFKMEPRFYNRHSVLNIVDLIISNKDSEIKSILDELKQSYTRQLKPTSTTN